MDLKVVLLLGVLIQEITLAVKDLLKEDINGFIKGNI
jgi:hypothetical protein